MKMSNTKVFNMIVLGGLLKVSPMVKLENVMKGLKNRSRNVITIPFHLTSRPFCEAWRLFSWKEKQNNLWVIVLKLIILIRGRFDFYQTGFAILMSWRDCDRNAFCVALYWCFHCFSRLLAVWMWLKLFLPSSCFSMNLVFRFFALSPDYIRELFLFRLAMEFCICLFEENFQSGESETVLLAKPAW